MPELIRLQTPDFEFSVWANDISQRLSMYQNTMAHRASANHAQPSYELRFAPAVQLSNAIEPQGLVADGLVQSGLDESGLVTNGLAKHAERTLNSPLFFENTQYQFEWVFFSEVTNARLTHRSQSVNEAFRFAPEVKTARGVVPARLTGTINTGNDVGWLRLPLTFEHNGKTQTQHIAFEVLPTKMALHQDLPTMYQAIDAVFPHWRFSLVEKTDQTVARSKKRVHFPLMWLESFKELRKRFENGLKVVCAAPHSRLQPKIANIKTAKLKGRLSHKLAEQVKQDFANGQFDKRYAVEKKQLSVDTPENRFIKMVVSNSKRQLAEFEQKLRQSNEALERPRLSEPFINEVHSWQKPLQKVLGQSFLKEVSAYTGLSRESLVLQQKTGYSAVYRIWQELKFYLDLFGDQSSISMKSVAEIYEVWCFLCLKQILEQDLGFELLENGATKLAQNDFFEYQLKDGFAGAFRFKRSDGVTARLAHEPKFTKKGQSIRTYLVSQEPDIVLEVTLPKSECSERGSSLENQFIWLFDAKYRIKTDKNRFDDSNEDIQSMDYVPDDAINQMHRYRDALIRLSEPRFSETSSSSILGQHAQKTRPVFGAFALYPGYFDQAKCQNPYAHAIKEVGIGAFALLPNQADSEGQNCHSGRLWLLKFLESQIGAAPDQQTPHANKSLSSSTDIAERLYIQEASRIPNYGMRQVLYSDLTMSVALGKYNERFEDCFEKFKDEKLNFYHLPVSTFQLKFEPHVLNEIQYLALIPNHRENHDISAVWPVRNIQFVKRRDINFKVTRYKSDSDEQYVLFELGKPLSLKVPIIFQPDGTFRHSIKITTIKQLEQSQYLNEVEPVYKKALA